MSEEKEESECWHLNMHYLGEDDVKRETGWSCPTKKPIEDLYEDIVKQMKAQDHEILDRAFEDAVNNLGRKQ